MVISGSWKHKVTSGVRVAGFVTFLIGWWWAVFQESCVQSEVTIFHLGWGCSSIEEFKDIVMHISLSSNQDPVWRLYQPLIVFFCFCIPSLPWLVIVWIHPLEFREGQGCWMKPISYRQEMENTEQICTPEPHRVLLSFNLGNRATTTVITFVKMGHRTASAWRRDTELEVFLSSKS